MNDKIKELEIEISEMTIDLYFLNKSKNPEHEKLIYLMETLHVNRRKLYELKLEQISS